MQRVFFALIANRIANTRREKARREASFFIGENDDTTNNRACGAYAEQAARDLVAALQLAHARFELRNALLFGGLVLTGWAAV